MAAIEKLRQLARELGRRRVYRVAVVYVTVGLVLIEAADLIFPALLLPDWTYRLVVILVLLGLPVAIVLAWGFDVTPEGVKRTPSSAGKTAAVRPSDGRPLLYAGAVLALLAAAAAYLLFRGPGEASEPTLDSIAVLPFSDLSPGQDQEYFADGVAEEILNALSGIEGLRVAARSSSFQFKDEDPDVREVGEKLGVSAVLEGSVRKSGEEIRVSAQLVNARDGYRLWADTYERGLSDIFAVQEEIARGVASRVRGRLSERDRSRLSRRPTGDAKAYDRYLKGNHELLERTPTSVRRAVEEYEAAIRLDPDFTAALARTAYAYALFVDWGWDYGGVSPDRLLEEGISLTRRALERDSASADAWMVRAYLLFLEGSERFADALRAFERAIALNPLNAEAYHQYGQTLMVLGCWEQAAAAYGRALSVEPTRAMTLVPLGAIELKSGRLSEAERWVDSAVAVDPTVAYAHAFRAVVRLRAGDPEGARASAETAIGLDTAYSVPARSTLARALVHLGDRTGAEAELEKALEAIGEPPSPTTARYVSGALTELGRVDDAVRLLERTRPRGAWLHFYLQTREFDRLREDPRVQRVLEESRPSVPPDRRCTRGL